MITFDTGFFDESICGGGSHQRVTQTIIAENGALSVLLPTALGMFPESGKIFFVGDSNAPLSAEAAEILGRKYRLQKVVANFLPDLSVAQALIPDEDARFMVGCGGGTTADLCKFSATKYGLKLIFIAASHATCGYLAKSSVLKKDGFREIFKTNPPEALIMDFSKLPDGDEFNAAGLGEVVSRLASLFDIRFSDIVEGTDYCSAVESAVLNIILSAFKSIKEKEDIKRTVALAAIKMSYVLQISGDSRLMSGGDSQLLGAFELMYENRGSKLKKQGENEMILALTVLNCYEAFLNGGDFALSSPPDNLKRLDALVKYFGVEEGKAFLKLRTYGNKDELFKNIHCIRENRDELLFKINVYKKIAALGYKIFKRLYKDMGYSYNNYISKKDLEICFGLAPDTREKYTALTHMRQLGLLDKFIA